MPDNSVNGSEIASTCSNSDCAPPGSSFLTTEIISGAIWRFHEQRDYCWIDQIKGFFQTNPNDIVIDGFGNVIAGLLLAHVRHLVYLRKRSSRESARLPRQNLAFVMNRLRIAAGRTVNKWT